jgi:hypothetical protein
MKNASNNITNITDMTRQFVKDEIIPDISQKVKQVALNKYREGYYDGAIDVLEKISDIMNSYNLSQQELLDAINKSIKDLNSNKNLE